MGGKKNADPDDVDPNDDLDDVDPDDDGDPDDEEFTPPKTKAELEALIKNSGNAEAKKWRLRAMGRDPKWKGPRSDDDSSKKDDKPESGKDGKTEAQIEAEVRQKIEAEYNEKAKGENLRASVATALLTAGLNLSEEEAKSPQAARKAVNRVVGMMDLGHMVLEDDGTISGLDDEISDLRKTYPGLFKSGGGRPRTAGGDAAPRRNGAGGKTDPLEELAEAWIKGS